MSAERTLFSIERRLRLIINVNLKKVGFVRGYKVIMDCWIFDWLNLGIFNPVITKAAICTTKEDSRIRKMRSRLSLRTRVEHDPRI